jgi:3,5-epimerase/4-reductase
MKRKILICGKGFIGERLQEALRADISADMIHSFADADRLVSRHHPLIVINAIGYTGARSVDDCESDKEAALEANVFVPIWLAEASIRRGVKFVHIGSGCIYHYDYKRDRPIAETRVPDFFDLFYSRTKIYADRALEVLAPQHNVLIVRIRIPLDDRPHPKNILDKLLRYRRVVDLPNSVTYIPDFARAMKHLLGIDAKGVYNVVNKGGMRYPDLLDVYKKFRPDFTYEVVDFKKLNLVRTNLLVSAKKLEDSGFRVRPIVETYEECVKNHLKIKS